MDFERQCLYWLTVSCLCIIVNDGSKSNSSFFFFAAGSLVKKVINFLISEAAFFQRFIIVQESIEAKISTYNFASFLKAEMSHRVPQLVTS